MREKNFEIKPFDWLCWGLTTTLVGHFVSSPREWEKRDSRRDEREGWGRNRNRSEIYETEEIKTFPLFPYLPQLQALLNCKPISVGCPSDVRYTTLLPHLTTPWNKANRSFQRSNYLSHLDATLFKGTPISPKDFKYMYKAGNFVSA